jgi:hypothetical protein
MRSYFRNLKSGLRDYFGGKGIRTPDFQLAKLALYQLSYAPEGIAEFRLPNVDCKEEKKTAGCRVYELASGSLCVCRDGEAAFVRCESGPILCRQFPPTGTAKYAVNTFVIGSTALPVISPLLFMSFALASTAG